VKCVLAVDCRQLPSSRAGTLSVLQAALSRCVAHTSTTLHHDNSTCMSPGQHILCECTHLSLFPEAMQRLGHAFHNSATWQARYDPLVHPRTETAEASTVLFPSSRSFHPVCSSRLPRLQRMLITDAEGDAAAAAAAAGKSPHDVQASNVEPEPPSDSSAHHHRKDPCPTPAAAGPKRLPVATLQNAGNKAPSPVATRQPPVDWHKRGVWIDPANMEKRMHPGDPVATRALEAETAVGRSLSAMIRVRPVFDRVGDLLQPHCLRVKRWSETCEAGVHMGEHTRVREDRV
jgi:hypothetical protein